jgi:hypothetical protein
MRHSRGCEWAGIVYRKGRECRVLERGREETRNGERGMTRTSAEVGGVPGARTPKAIQPQVPASEEIGFKPTREEKSADKCESVSVI